MPRKSFGTPKSLEIPQGWEELFNSNSDLLRQILKKIQPYDCKYIFEAYHFTPLNNIRVVILGNNPFRNI